MKCSVKGCRNEIVYRKMCCTHHFHKIYGRKKRGRPRMIEEFFYDPHTVMIDPEETMIHGQRIGIWT